MEAYRDQYATIFNGGKGVTVIGISTDEDTVQADWAREARFPITFASGSLAKVAKLYDVKYPLLNTARRVVFVIDPTGKISAVMDPFKQQVADSYTELGGAVAAATKGPPGKP